MNEFKQKLKIEYGNMQDIPLEPMTEEDLKKYEEHKRKRNERIYRKFEDIERWLNVQIVTSSDLVKKQVKK